MKGYVKCVYTKVYTVNDRRMPIEAQGRPESILQRHKVECPAWMAGSVKCVNTKVYSTNVQRMPIEWDVSNDDNWMVRVTNG